MPLALNRQGRQPHQRSDHVTDLVPQLERLAPACVQRLGNVREVVRELSGVGPHAPSRWDRHREALGVLRQAIPDRRHVEDQKVAHRRAAVAGSIVWELLVQSCEERLGESDGALSHRLTASRASIAAARSTTRRWNASPVRGEPGLDRCSAFDYSTGGTPPADR